MHGVVLRAGAGERLFDGRILIKAAFEQLSVTETFHAGARAGADPHLHRHHADSFYVLEGELAFLVHDREHLLGPGGFVCAPPGVVHGFRSTSAARYLNFHTPDCGFADNLRARDRGEPGGFDSVDAAVGSGLDASHATLLHAGDGDRREGDNGVDTIKAGSDELAVVELDLVRGFAGPDPHVHDDRVDAFYVLDGEAEFLVGDEWHRLGAGSFVAAPPGAVHTFSCRASAARLLNVHAPSGDFHVRLRGG